MDAFVNISVFAISVAIVWFFAGILIESVHRIARHFHKTGFATAFFILGFLTSISEFSVALNSTIQKVPAASVGNLIGASFVVLLFIVPLLAIANGGVGLANTISKRNLALALAAIALPALLVIDGNVTWIEGLVSLLVYFTLMYSIYHQKKSSGDMTEQAEPEDVKVRPLIHDIGRVIGGGIMIFLASRVLVDQAVFFSTTLGVPVSLVGLILLSLGTNVPEIVVAIRSVLKHRADIAFGDYLGSAAMNTFVFGLLALANGRFLFNAGEVSLTTTLLVVGLILFFIFAESNYRISRKEGSILALFYLSFVGIQIFKLAQFASS